MSDAELRNHKAQVLSLRMVLAALRHDEDAFRAAFTDLSAVREAELDANGESDALYRVLRITAATAAGAHLDADEAHGGDLNRAERFLEDWIENLLDGVGQ